MNDFACWIAVPLIRRFENRFCVKPSATKAVRSLSLSMLLAIIGGASASLKFSPIAIPMPIPAPAPAAIGRSKAWSSVMLGKAVIELMSRFEKLLPWMNDWLRPLAKCFTVLGKSIVSAVGSTNCRL